MQLIKNLVSQTSILIPNEIILVPKHEEPDLLRSQKKCCMLFVRAGNLLRMQQVQTWERQSYLIEGLCVLMFFFSPMESLYVA